MAHYGTTVQSMAGYKQHTFIVKKLMSMYLFRPVATGWLYLCMEHGSNSLCWHNIFRLFTNHIPTLWICLH